MTAKNAEHHFGGTMQNEPTNTRVIIIGGGFAGVSCAQKLAEHSAFEIVLLDRNNYHQFQPLLYQVATGSLSPANAAFNLRSVLSHHENVNVKMTEVVSVNVSTRVARCASGQEYQGDYLVLAAGAEANFFGVPGAAEFAFPLYSLQDAERLRSRLIEILETADRQGEAVSELMRVVVVGGGATGVEVAGAIADVFRNEPRYIYKDIDLSKIRVTLLDRAPNVLGPFSRKSQEYAAKVLTERGVELRVGVSVKEVARESVLLGDGTRVAASLVVWAGGLKASALSGKLGIQPGRGGRIDVSSDLSVTGLPGVFALGDFANFSTSEGDVLPQLASVAQQAGRHCAANIIAHSTGREMQPFEYFDKGIMAMVGRNAAVAEVGAGHHVLTGPLAFAAWLGVHALLLTTLRARMEAFMQWAWEYFGHSHVDPILDRPSVKWSPEPESHLE